MGIAILAVALVVLATALIGVGLAGLTGRLPRNRWIGLRTTAVCASDETWRTGHRAAGRTLIAAAGPPLLLAVALVAMPPDEIADWFLVYAVVGVITGGLLGLAVRGADRAAGRSDDDADA